MGMITSFLTGGKTDILEEKMKNHEIKIDKYNELINRDKIISEKNKEEFKSGISNVKELNRILTTLKESDKIDNYTSNEIKKYEDYIDFYSNKTYSKKKVILSGLKAGTLTLGATVGLIVIFGSTAAGGSIIGLPVLYATNAILAFAGGGAIAAGGGGMIAGGYVLAGVFAIPVIGFGIYSLNKDVDKKLEQIKNQAAKLDNEYKKISKRYEFTNGIFNKTKEMNKLFIGTKESINVVLFETISATDPQAKEKLRLILEKIINNFFKKFNNNFRIKKNVILE